LTAKLQDISCDGIGLILNDTVATGTILNVELYSKSQSVPYFLLARVVWTKKRRDGMLMAGCQFARPLCDDELDALL
jgi:hypothetical protein